MSTIAITGRLQALSIAEIEAVFGSEAIKSINAYGVVLDDVQDPGVFNQLGGTQKAARFLKELPGTDWRNISAGIMRSVTEIAAHVDGKIILGLSVHGLNITPRAVNATALELKKKLKSSGRSVRVVPNKTLELNTAQTLHNKLTGMHGIELLVIRNKNNTLLAQTVWVQDIDAYAARDQARPKRDSRVGMLPPKLAQTIINLSGFDSGKSLLDPFCGTGVVLQEALLMGGQAIGSDLEPRMIEYSSRNLEWLAEKFGPFNYDLSVGDATSHTWSVSFDVIACETYLGRPLSALPDEQTLSKIIKDVDTIHRKFLHNVARQTQSGFRMCIAVPAWKTKRGFRHLPVLDHLEELGYNRVSFVHVSTNDLVYYREDQTVARELVVLVRK